MYRSLSLLVSAVFVALLAACSGAPAQSQRTYPQPKIENVIARLLQKNQQAQTFSGETRMDYWLDGDRVNATVLAMGRAGAFIRINAENPTGGNVASDLACDGKDFKYVDYNHNCQLTGTCSRSAIAQLLRVSMEPDDFLILAVGSTPVIEHDDAEIEWDGSRGYEVIRLMDTSAGLVQTVVIDGREDRWDLISSEVEDRKSGIEWRLRNKDFISVSGGQGQQFRVPRKSRFEQPKFNADLIITWEKRSINLEIDDAKFEMEIPPGLPTCTKKSS